MLDLLRAMAEIFRRSKVLVYCIVLYFVVVAFFGFCVSFGWHLARITSKAFL
jgi:hypothetical protein